MQFSSIPNHKDLKTSLVEAHNRNHIAHAQLFNGKEGSVALPLALSFASFLLCENKSTNDSCGTCANCVKMSKFIHPDVHFFFPSSKADKDSEKADKAQKWREFLQENPYGNIDDLTHFLGSENKLNQIGKDDAREIVRKVSMKSFEGGLKIIMIWYPEFLNGAAANAILKILEEPPANTIYLLVSHNYENVLPTILSRTQLVTVPPLGNEEVATFLASTYEIPETEAQRLAKISGGNIGEVIRLTKNDNDISFQSFQTWMQYCFKQDNISLVKWSEDISRLSKSDQRTLLSYGTTLIRNAIIAQYAPSLIPSTGAESDFVKKFGQTVAKENLEVISKDLSDCFTALLRNANPKIIFLALSLRISKTIRARVTP